MSDLSDALSAIWTDSSECYTDEFARLQNHLAATLGGSIDIVFDGPPSHESWRFVEVEQSGRSIRFGEWVQREDGYWVLRFSYPTDFRERCEQLEARVRELEHQTVCDRHGHNPRILDCPCCVQDDLIASQAYAARLREALQPVFDAERVSACRVCGAEPGCNIDCKLCEWMAIAENALSAPAPDALASATTALAEHDERVRWEEREAAWERLCADPSIVVNQTTLHRIEEAVYRAARVAGEE
jgi:hypothetical protein